MCQRTGEDMRSGEAMQNGSATTEGSYEKESTAKRGRGGVARRQKADADRALAPRGGEDASEAIAGAHAEPFTRSFEDEGDLAVERLLMAPD